MIGKIFAEGLRVSRLEEMMHAFEPVPYLGPIEEVDGREGVERPATALREAFPDVVANRIVHDDARGDRGSEEVLRLEPMDRPLPFRRETMERVQGNESTEQGGGLEDRPLVLRQGRRTNGRGVTAAVRVCGRSRCDSCSCLGGCC